MSSDSIQRLHLGRQAEDLKIPFEVEELLDWQGAISACKDPFQCSKALRMNHHLDTQTCFDGRLGDPLKFSNQMNFQWPLRVLELNSGNAKHFSQENVSKPTSPQRARRDENALDFGGGDYSAFTRRQWVEYENINSSCICCISRPKHIFR